MAQNNPGFARYSMGAIVLHWLIALLIALNFAAAWISDDMPKPEKEQIMGNHMAIGMSILVLTIIRIGWRLGHRPPPLADTLKAWEVALARVSHALFYVVMLAMPLTGWIMNSAFTGGEGIRFFGLFTIPGLPLQHDKATAGAFHDAHSVLANLMLALFALHVAGALKHRILDKDAASILRIMPWGKG